MSHEPLAEMSSGDHLAAQLRIACMQTRRTPYAVLLADALLVWLVWREQPTVWAFVWWLTAAAALFGRAWHAGRWLQSAGERPEAGALDLRRLAFWFFAVGLTQSGPVLMVMALPPPGLHTIVTMVMVGLAAGGVGSCGGLLTLYLAWAAPLALSLVLSWAATLDFEGGWIALLLVLMFALLVGNVRIYGQTLRRQAELAGTLRRERDRADAERDRAQAQWHRAEAERARAEEAVLARTRFFASASHDLRQPLGVLRWYGDAVVAHARQLEHDRLLAIGEGMARALDRAEPLLGQYLDIARIDTLAQPVSLAACPLGSLLESVREAFAQEAEERGLVLRLQLEAPAARLVALSDAAMLRSILENLVGNALKFTQRGEVVLGARPQPGADTSPRSLQVWVRDTGIGIAADAQPRVFDDFYQVDNPSRTASQGVGLGLAIARRQAQRLGFVIRLHSAPGEGSEFSFDLPAAGPGQAAPPRQPPSAPPATRRLRVLVVDDEPEALASLRLLLEAHDGRVATAATLEACLAVLRDGFRPDVLVVDHRLQGDLTGIELIATLQTRGCKAPAVIVTGDTAPDRLQALAASGWPVLHKPVPAYVLLRTIADAVQARGASQAPAVSEPGVGEPGVDHAAR